MDYVQNLQIEIRRRLIDEGIARIKKCLLMLTEDRVWWRPNDASNSIGNIILHLDGNVRQWLIGSFSDFIDNRNRDEEFKLENRISINALESLLNKLSEDIESILPTIEKIDLTTQIPVQIYTESGISIIIHVIEHFSYHVGQITYATKMITDNDTGYYAGENL